MTLLYTSTILLLIWLLAKGVVVVKTRKEITSPRIWDSSSFWGDDIKSYDPYRPMEVTCNE